MGARERVKQKKLAAKLKAIREALNLSQGGVVQEFGLDEHGLGRTNISGYELGRIEPPIYVLEAYAEAANVCLDILLKDQYDLPDDLPCKTLYHPHK